MSMIFIGGSREIFELPEPAIARIGAIVAAEHGVLIGDAPGAEMEVQSLLAGYGYEHVGVFCAGNEPRNNLGNWAVYPVSPPNGASGLSAQTQKDREMARRADYGLMIWDGEDPDTFLNVLRLAMAEKPCVTYDVVNWLVTTTHNFEDWRVVLSRTSPRLRQLLAERMTPNEQLAMTPV
ncbi:hypothetical protein [Mesorhizobium sp. WSM3224]|uniref:hypothetical protein n=1 Tax=Mesorhizobium sp. WSM3224 TaxID=1040986 RepID=UPI00048950D1|nr:hypothetical protein [Mesorhizobium sp. WSM3224]